MIGIRIGVIIGTMTGTIIGPMIGTMTVGVFMPMCLYHRSASLHPILKVLGSSTYFLSIPGRRVPFTTPNNKPVSRYFCKFSVSDRNPSFLTFWAIIATYPHISMLSSLF